MAPIVMEGVKPPYPFTLEYETKDGVGKINLQLSYDFNAAVLVEDQTGVSLLSGAIFSDESCKNLSVLLWAMAQEHQPALSGEKGLRALRSKMTLRNSAAVRDAVQEVFIRNLPDDQQDRIRAAAKPEGGENPLVAATPAAA